MVTHLKQISSLEKKEKYGECAAVVSVLGCSAKTCRPAKCDLKSGSVVDLSWQPGQLQSKREPLLPAIRGTLHQDPPLPRCAEARSPAGAAGL